VTAPSTTNVPPVRRALVAPIAYTTRTRLAVAATLLQRMSLSIAEAARRTGYSSRACFAREFKRAFGVAPGA
jgi:AraC-like DNA-binding protein